MQNSSKRYFTVTTSRGDRYVALAHSSEQARRMARQHAERVALRFATANDMANIARLYASASVEEGEGEFHNRLAVA